MSVLFRLGLKLQFDENSFTYRCFNIISGTEIVGPSQRKFAAIVNKYFYSLGQLLLAAIAYNLRDWSSIELAISLPALLLRL